MKCLLQEYEARQKEAKATWLEQKAVYESNSAPAAGVPVAAAVIVCRLCSVQCHELTSTCCKPLPPAPKVVEGPAPVAETASSEDDSDDDEDSSADSDEEDEDEESPPPRKVKKSGAVKAESNKAKEKKQKKAKA